MRLSVPIRLRRLGGLRSFTSQKTVPLKPVNKVTVIGAAGGIGQPLSLLFKTGFGRQTIKHLSLYDVAPTMPGVALDLAHCDTGPAMTTGHTGEKELPTALEGSDLVIIPAGVPRKPGMTRDDLFNINASIVAGVAKMCGKICPNAFFLVISNPVNSTVPIFAEILKRVGNYNPKKLFGVTHLDVCRANTFVAAHLKRNVAEVRIPVIGGHAGTTILPLLSTVKNANFSKEDVASLTQRVMFGGDEVVKAKAGAGSATLSMAHAGHVFAAMVLAAKEGAPVKACAFVESKACPEPGVSFFASPLQLGPNGVEKFLELPALSPFEKEKLKEMIPDLKSQIQKGIDFAKNYDLSK